MFGVGAPPASLHSQHQQRAELPCAGAAAPCSPQRRHSPKPSTAPDTPALCSLADSQGSPVPCPAVLFQPRITFPRYKSALTVSAVLASARCLEHVELGLRGEGSTGGGGGDGAGERRSSSSGKKKKKAPTSVRGSPRRERQPYFSQQRSGETCGAMAMLGCRALGCPPKICFPLPSKHRGCPRCQPRGSGASSASLRPLEMPK